MLSNVLVSIAIWLNTLTNFNFNLFDRRKYRAEFSTPSSCFLALYPSIELSKVRRVYWPSLVFNRQGQVKHVYWVIKGPLKSRFYDYWKIQRNETIEQICAGLSYLYDHDLSHNNLDLRTIFMIQSDTGDRPVIGGFDRLSKMSLAIDASCLARIIISGEPPKIYSYQGSRDGFRPPFPCLYQHFSYSL